MFRYALLLVPSALLFGCSSPSATKPVLPVEPATGTPALAPDTTSTAYLFGGLVLKLIGEWKDEQSDDKSVFHEHWARTDDAFYAGLGFVMSGKDTSFIEHLNIHAGEDGVYYSARIPSQNGGSYVDFALTSAIGDSMVFENKEHDFPQRIVYAWQNDGTWKVNVSGPGKSGTRTDSYHFLRSGGSPD